MVRLPSWRVESWKPESVLLGRPVANALLLVLLVLLLVMPIMAPPDLLSYRGCSSWPGSFESMEPKEGTTLLINKVGVVYRVVRSSSPAQRWITTQQTKYEEKERQGKMAGKENRLLGMATLPPPIETIAWLRKDDKETNQSKRHFK